LTSSDVWTDLFAVSPGVRYVAMRTVGEPQLRQRDGIAQASSSESDRYEERLVNPTLLKLLGERGRIDCGGLEFVVVRYGHFFQIVQPVPGGHVSIAVEPDADPLELVAPVQAALRRHRLLPEAA